MKEESREINQTINSGKTNLLEHLIKHDEFLNVNLDGNVLDKRLILM